MKSTGDGIKEMTMDLLGGLVLAILVIIRELTR